MQFSVSSFIFNLLALFAIVSFAAPIEKRDVFVPPLLVPTEHTVWKIGTNETVSWDLSHAPAQITNKFGRIILQKDGLLDVEHPLAIGFDILLGKYTVTVPNVTPGIYQIVLFGDSGNSGKKFRIVQ